MGQLKEHYYDHPEHPHTTTELSPEEITDRDPVGNWLDNLEKYLENVDNLGLERDIYW